MDGAATRNGPFPDLGQREIIEAKAKIMDQEQFAAVSSISDEISEVLDQALLSQELAELRGLISKLSQTLGPDYFVNLNLTLDVTDLKREQTLPILTTGLGGTEGKDPFRTWGDSSVHRYLADNEIKVVPHDRCPNCWDVWDFKFINQSCSNCGATLGRDVKVLLDSDVCPHCDEGTVSMSTPTCKKCGFKISPDLVVWG